MSLSAKREALARIHGRAGRPHKTRIIEEFCATCGYHRQATLRLLNRPLHTTPPKRSGPKRIYEPAQVLPVLKAIWLASDQPCSKLLRAALPQWLDHHQRRAAPLPEAFKKKLRKISAAQIDRLLRPARVQHPKRGLSTTRPGTLPLRQAVPTRGGPPDTTRPGGIAVVNANVLGASFVGGSFKLILPAGLKAAGMERAWDSSLRLVVRNADGTPMTAVQAAKYQVNVIMQPTALEKAR